MFGCIRGETVPDSLSFDVTGSPARILFGRGARARCPDVLRDLGIARALVLSTEGQKQAADAFACTLGKSCLGVLAGAVMHTPVSATEAALEIVRESRVDGLVAFGGGSTVGLSKALAWRTDLPQVVLPTTYSGSEVTNILGQTENGAKATLKSPKVIPEAVIYDPELTLGLPVGISVTSGLNALAHAVEGLYARDRNPVSAMMAAEGTRALVEALPRIAASPTDIAARERAMVGSWLCGMVLGQVGMALHHKLCHVLGGLFDLPHAETHSVVLPHVTAFNARAVPGLLAPLAQALGADAPGAGLWTFARALGAPMALRDLGMPESGIARAAEVATANPYWNPVPVERDATLALIRAAWAGERPDG
jgi:maleylacetate reductase